MSYLVDTDWVADYLRGRAPALELLRRLRPEGLTISLITVGEIYEGIYYGRDIERMEAVFQQFLQRVMVVPLDEETMRSFAIMRGLLRAQGLSIGDPDVIIAASAIQYELILVTRNLRHFTRIPGLQLYEAG